MKIVHESIFANSLRSFFVAFFALIGLFVAALVICVGLYGLYSLAKEETLASDIKILPDADGNRKELSSDTPVLLQINVKGEIGEHGITSEKIEKVLLKSREGDLKNNRVKGLLVVIDSPGGGVNDSDKIYHLLKEYKQRYKVPIVAYTDGLCASGGYYIACSADEILSSGVSVIGSVGVLSWPPFMNVHDALEKIGVGGLTLSAGKGKDELNPLRTWKPGEQDNYQHLLDFFYHGFTSIVLQNRPSITEEKLVQSYGARVFPAPQAKELGYVDGANVSRSDAIKRLKELSGIPEDKKIQVVTFETKGWIEKWIEDQAEAKTNRMEHEIVLPREWRMKGNLPLQYIHK